MKQPNWSRCTEEQLWKYVATHLDQHGIKTVLVGDGASCVHTSGACNTPKLEFVLLTDRTTGLNTALAELGFKPQADGLYRHPHCKNLALEFKPGPLAVGDDFKINPLAVGIGKQSIFILAPTDCIRAGLARYIHDGSREHLELAAQVGARQSFNESKIQKFCVAEGAPRVYAEFENQVEATVPHED